MIMLKSQITPKERAFDQCGGSRTVEPAIQAREGRFMPIRLRSAAKCKPCAAEVRERGLLGLYQLPECKESDL